MELCLKINTIMSNVLLVLDEDGLRQCMTCLMIKSVSDVDYYAPQLSRNITRLHYPITVLQFLGGCLKVFIMKFLGKECEIVPKTPFMPTDTMGRVEVVCDLDVWQFVKEGVIHENYDVCSPIQENIQTYDEFLLSIQDTF